MTALERVEAAIDAQDTDLIVAAMRELRVEDRAAYDELVSVLVTSIEIESL